MVFRCESQVLPVDQEAGSSVLQTIGELSSFHLAERSRRPTETLRAVLNVNRSLGGGGELDEVLGRALGSLMELFSQTECGVIVTADPDGRLPIRAIQRRVGPPPKLTLSRTILHQVLEKGEAVLIRDVATDERFKLHESIAALFRTALCVPLPGTDGKPLGMVQLGAREDGSCRFNSDDLELLAALALPMAVAVENDRLIRERATGPPLVICSAASYLAIGPRSRDTPSGNATGRRSRWAATSTITSACRPANRGATLDGSSASGTCRARGCLRR